MVSSLKRVGMAYKSSHYAKFEQFEANTIIQDQAHYKNKKDVQ